MNETNFVGTSFEYPFNYNTRRGIAKVSGIDNLKQSMSEAINTPLGSRFFNEDYGSLVSRLSFEQNDKILESLLEFHINESIRLWEKRVKIINILFENVSENQKNCRVIFEIRETKQIDILVYPFFKEI